MDILYGIFCIVIAIFTLYFLLKDNSILNSLKELETDRGISYYGGLFAAIIFLIMGISMIVNFFD